MLRIPNTWADFKNSNISSDATHTGGIFPNTPILILCIKVNKLQLRLCLTKNNCQKFYILKAQFERCILLISVDRKEKYALRRSFFEDKPGWWHGWGIWIWKYFENPTQEALDVWLFLLFWFHCVLVLFTLLKRKAFSLSMNVKQIEIVSVQCAVLSELEKWGNIMGQWSLIANLSIG